MFDALVVLHCFFKRIPSNIVFLDDTAFCRVFTVSKNLEKFGKIKLPLNFYFYFYKAWSSGKFMIINGQSNLQNGDSEGKTIERPKNNS